MVYIGYGLQSFILLLQDAHVDHFPFNICPKLIGFSGRQFRQQACVDISYFFEPVEVGNGFSIDLQPGCLKAYRDSCFVRKGGKYLLLLLKGSFLAFAFSLKDHVLTFQ